MIKVLKTIEEVELNGEKYEVYDMPVWVHREQEKGNDVQIFDVIESASNIPNEVLLSLGVSQMNQLFDIILKLSSSDGGGEKDGKKKA